MDRHLIRFDQPRAPYATGDIAGFAPAVSAAYVKGNFAHYCDRDGKPVDRPTAVPFTAPKREVIEQGTKIAKAAA